MTSFGAFVFVSREFLPGLIGRLIDIEKQSARLHSEVAQSAFHRLPDNGHMIHQTATDEVMAAIDEVARDAA